jgi:hypothetical protein
VAAIQSLHRPDVKVETHGEFDGFTALGLFGAAFGWMLAIGLTLFFYKLICRWMGIPHDI